MPAAPKTPSRRRRSGSKRKRQPRAAIPLLRELGATVAAGRPGAASGPVTARFDNLSSHLTEFIRASEVVVGCFAWMSHPDVLAALCATRCCVVVQKEKFIRPSARDARYAPTRKRYASLDATLDRRSFPSPLSDVMDPKHPRSWKLDPVRVVGNCATGNRNGSALMHHKFLVRATTTMVKGREVLVPQSVWLASANATKNSDASLEFGVEVDDPVIAAAFLNEFARVCAISEPLAWTSPSASPQWVPRPTARTT